MHGDADVGVALVVGEHVLAVLGPVVDHHRLVVVLEAQPGQRHVGGAFDHIDQAVDVARHGQMVGPDVTRLARDDEGVGVPPVGEAAVECQMRQNDIVAAVVDQKAMVVDRHRPPAPVHGDVGRKADVVLERDVHVPCEAHPYGTGRALHRRAQAAGTGIGIRGDNGELPVQSPGGEAAVAFPLRQQAGDFRAGRRRRRTAGQGGGGGQQGEQQDDKRRECHGVLLVGRQPVRRCVRSCPSGKTLTFRPIWESPVEVATLSPPDREVRDPGTGFNRASPANRRRHWLRRPAAMSQFSHVP